MADTVSNTNTTGTITVPMTPTTPIQPIYPCPTCGRCPTCGHYHAQSPQPNWYYLVSGPSNGY